MQFSSFEPKGRLKQQIRFQTAFLSTSRHSNQTKAVHRHTHIGSTASKIIIRSGVDTTTPKTANFERHSLSGMTLRADMIKQLEIHLAIPAQTNKEQRLQLQRVVEYGKNRNITVKITEIK